MNKTALKFFGIALLFVLVGAGIVWGVDYYQRVRSPEYQVELEMKKLEAAAKADTYGGSTPEETLALFIDALKKGDIDLASKYFVVDEQENGKKELVALSGTQVQNIINDILVAKKNSNSQEKDKAVFEYTKQVQSGFTEVGGKKIDIPFGNYLQTVVLVKNINNRWKILEL